VSIFRASAKVTAPDGREWEIYAYKLRAGRQPGRLLPRTARRLAAAVRALRGDDWIVDAQSHLPRPTVYRWTTTTEYKGQVLAQVEGHLARGDVPHRLTNAVYRGERRSAR
jgi:hypothetical protein